MENINLRVKKKPTGGGLPNTELIRMAIGTMNNHLKYMEYLLERRFWLVTNKIELADLTAASHISCLDYLGDIPWEKFPEIKLWYSRIKSRPSFRSILTMGSWVYGVNFPSMRSTSLTLFTSFTS